MKYYLAPLEGITNVFYRTLHEKYFHGVDKYYIPFINPTQKNLTPKEKREIDPVLNQSKKVVVPQILSKNAEETLWLINLLKEDGYTEVNINCGCPSGTVSGRGRGAGLLRDLDYFDAFLKEVYEKSPLPVSLKIRLGMNNPDEIYNILKVINQYPVSELIVHPRTAKEGYKGELHLNFFEEITKLTKIDLIYNGDVKTKADIEYIQNKFPTIKGIMIGRGLITSPDLLEEETSLDFNQRKEILKNFYYSLRDLYLEKFGPNNTLYYVKEIWSLLIFYFDISNDLKKCLFKSKTEKEFNSYVLYVFEKCQLNSNMNRGINAENKN